MLRERPADDLVERVVPADVLAQAEELAVGIEEAGGVQAAGGREGGLRLAQAVGKRGDASRAARSAGS